MNNKSGSLGVCSILGIIFVTLKLCGVINWSWWAVLSPFIVPIALTVLLFAAIYLFKSIL